MENGTGMWMTSCPEAMGWEFWRFLKKAVSCDLNLGEGRPVVSYRMRGAFVGSVSWDLNQGEGSPVVSSGMRDAFVGSVSWDWNLGRPVQLGSWLKDDVGTVSIVKIMSLSSRVKKLKVKKKVNKRFIPERRLCFGISMHFTYSCIWLCYT